ncbi:MAG: hypothetical protein Q9180_001430 [Flavoplaca navasiana]
MVVRQSGGIEVVLGKPGHDARTRHDSSRTHMARDDAGMDSQMCDRASGILKEPPSLTTDDECPRWQFAYK